MGIAERRFLKGMGGFYNEPVTDKIRASVKKKDKEPLRQVSAKKKAKAGEEKELFAADKEFYAEIWQAAPHVCEACKVKLPKEPLTIFFHHALAKQSFPGFRHTAENIIILCPDCHTQVEISIDKVPYVKKRTAQIRKELLK